MQDDPFLEAVISAPDDDGLRLIYADWLEEQGDPRGEALRVAVRLEELLEQYPAPEEPRAKLQRLREIGRLKTRYRELCRVVPLDWLLRLQRGCIEYCNRWGQVDCPRRWECLQETAQPAVRRCGHCTQLVRFCWSVSAVEQAMCARHPFVRALALVPV